MSHRPEDLYEYVAVNDITSGTVCAFKAGDPVPADTVEALGLLDSGDAVHRDNYEKPEGEETPEPMKRGDMPPHLRKDTGGDVAGTPANAGTGSDADKTGTQPDEPARPSADDTKPAWVDYASNDRTPGYISREEASGMTKSALMDRFK